MRTQLDEIRKAGERSTSLTRQLLAFSRKQMLAPKVLDLNEIVRDTETLLRRLIGENLDLVTVLPPGLGSVTADPGQISQILINLAVNARDAMPDGGKLAIETKNVELDEAFARTHPDAHPGPYVQLQVTDSGLGMTAEVKSRIFEPFFTTKEPGKGTGLGLSVIHGIVQQSGGVIDVESESGVGTTFKIYLPRVEQAASKADAPSSPVPERRDNEVILLVEDEESLRVLVRYLLEQGGYTVLIAAEGGEALNAAAAFREPIHLLITDVVMPGMSGTVLAERLLAIHPEMKVLYMSGYSDDLVFRHGFSDERASFLQKPFLPADLAQKVREALTK
jgi:CheY-like chemotaxis protein